MPRLDFKSTPPDSTPRWALVALAIALFFGVYGLQRAIDPRLPSTAATPGPSAPTRAEAHALFLGYDGLAADIYWTEAIQYFGAMHLAHSTAYPQLAPLLNLSVDLDPKLETAGEYGSLFLGDDSPQGAGEPYAAVTLLRKVIADNPGDWIPYFDLGFVYALNLRDRHMAAETFLAGSRVPGANPAMAVLAADYFGRADERKLAETLWMALYHGAPNADLRANALDHWQALRVGENFVRLGRIVADYHRRTGSWPATWRQLAAAGDLKGIPVDPQGRPYRLMPEGGVALDPQTHIVSLRETLKDSFGGDAAGPG